MFATRFAVFSSSSTRTLGLALGIAVVSCSGSGGGPPEATRTFVGRVGGGGTFVGLAITGEKANLFFCGTGSTLATDTHWIPGTVKSGETFHFSDGVADATGTASGTRASGTFRPTAGGHSQSWSADLVPSTALAAVYDEQNAEGNAALIVLPPTGGAAAAAQGAFIPPKGAILQVTPYAPLALSAGGVPVEVQLAGVTKRWVLPRATGN